MAKTGIAINTAFKTRMSPSDCVQQVLTSLNNVGGNWNDSSESVLTSNTLITITRKYRPTWAIVLTVILTLVVLIGLLLILYKAKETCTIAFNQGEDGYTNVQINGIVSPDVYNVLQVVIGQMQTA